MAERVFSKVNQTPTRRSSAGGGRNVNRASLISGMMGGMTIPRASPYKQMGVPGTAVMGGYISPIERNPKWVGQNKYRTSSDIAVNVSIVAAGLYHFLNLLAHPNWSVKPSDEDNKLAVQHAEFVEDIMGKMATPWPRIVRRAGMYRFHGFSIQEWQACKRDDGNIGILDIEPRPQYTIEKWELDNEGTIQGIWQRSVQTGALFGIPRTKFIYLVEDTLTDSPEGLGVFRHLGEPFERLKQYMALEAMAFERDLRGIPIGRAPISLINQLVDSGKISKEDGVRMTAGIRDFIELKMKEPDTALLLDSMPYESINASGVSVSGINQWGVELLTGPGTGLGELDNAIKRLQLEMARIIGTESMMMGAEGSGNRSLAQDKSRNLYLIANSVLANICQAFKKDMLDPLWTLNAWPEETKPDLITEDVAFKDVQEVTAALAQMAQAGAVLAPDDPAIGDVRDLLGISRAESLIGVDTIGLRGWTRVKDRDPPKPIVAPDPTAAPPGKAPPKTPSDVAAEKPPAIVRPASPAAKRSIAEAIVKVLEDSRTDEPVGRKFGKNEEIMATKITLRPNEEMVIKSDEGVIIEVHDLPKVTKMNENHDEQGRFSSGDGGGGGGQGTGGGGGGSVSFNSEAWTGKTNAQWASDLKGRLGDSKVVNGIKHELTHFSGELATHASAAEVANVFAEHILPHLHGSGHLVMAATAGSIIGTVSRKLGVTMIVAKSISHIASKVITRAPPIVARKAAADPIKDLMKRLTKAIADYDVSGADDNQD